MNKKIILAACLLVASLLLYAGCNGQGKAGLEFVSGLTETERYYYTGEELDSYAWGEGGYFSKIPEIYAVYPDGTKSEDLSHTDKVTFSGYDLDTPGFQTVNVTYKDENGKEIKGSYEICVLETQITGLEIHDTLHYKKGFFRVGDTFTTYTENPDGYRYGVSVILTYNDPARKAETYFANDPKVSGIKFDTSECRLDGYGRFTEAGEFTVNVTLGSLKSSYLIKVK